ncbi:MAG: hypothetical protein AABN95_00025 [Acidobacteriota bacterium]
MKRFLGAIALACVFSVSALAGDVPTAGITSPQPGDVPTAGITSPQPGDVPTGGIASTSGETESSLTTTVLLTILGLLSF